VRKPGASWWPMKIEPGSGFYLGRYCGKVFFILTKPKRIIRELRCYRVTSNIPMIEISGL